MSDAESRSPRYATCRCQHCDGHIEFDAAELDSSDAAAGTITVPCPHCGLDTALFVPEAEIEATPPEPPPPPKSEPEKASISIPWNGPPASSMTLPKPEPKKAKRVIKETTYYGGVEERLENVGDIFLAFSFIGGVIALGAATISLSLGEKAEQGGFLLVVGVVAIAQGIVIRVLFKGGAEIIRLLKKSNGLKFSGKITQPNAYHSYKCSLCDAVAPYGTSQKRCHSCGAEFES